MKLLRASLSKVDLSSPFCTWKGTNFFELFKEEDFDIVQTCRPGHKEFPFTKIRKIPFIDIIALSSGSDNQYNLARVLHLCSWSLDAWVRRGGDKARARLVSLPISIEEDSYSDLRERFNLGDSFVFGMHQRKSDDIFSPMPLAAYAKIENENTSFVLLGGGDFYKKQAKELGIKTIYFLEQTGDISKVFEFLRTLNVYAHGRKDGEVNSQAMAEALYLGLPIVSHYSTINNGHIESIGNAGKVVRTVDEYREEMTRLMNDTDYYSKMKANALQRFQDHYELNGQIAKYVDIYEDVYKNPFPNKMRRFLTSIHYRQNLRIVLVWLYLKFRYRD